MGKRDRAFVCALGKRIQAARDALALNQSQLGDRCGKGQGAVSQWERGEHEPSGVNLIALARALKTTPNHLLGWEDEVEPERSLTEQFTEALCEPVEQDEAPRTQWVEPIE